MLCRHIGAEEGPGAGVMVYIHQLDGLLHHGATLSFDVAHEYYSPRSCLIACCPIVRDAMYPVKGFPKLWMTIDVMSHGRPCLQPGAGKG